MVCVVAKNNNDIDRRLAIKLFPRADLGQKPRPIAVGDIRNQLASSFMDLIALPCHFKPPQPAVYEEENNNIMTWLSLVRLLNAV